MDPNPHMSYEDYHKLLEGVTFESKYPEWFDEWRVPISKPSSPMERTSPGMRESWITHVLENRGLKRQRSSVSYDWERNRSIEDILRYGCGGDTTPPFVFTAWLCALSGLIEETKTVNTYFSSHTSRLSPTFSPLGSECEMCTFPTVRTCSARILFNTHSSKVLRSGEISIFAVMGAGISGPLIAISQQGLGSRV